MKSSTKTLLIVGGVGVVAYYLYTQSQANSASNALMAVNNVGSDGQPSSNPAQDIAAVLQDFGVGVS